MEPVNSAFGSTQLVEEPLEAHCLSQILCSQGAVISDVFLPGTPEPLLVGKLRAPHLTLSQSAGLKMFMSICIASYFCIATYFLLWNSPRCSFLPPPHSVDRQMSKEIHTVILAPSSPNKHGPVSP